MLQVNLSQAEIQKLNYERFHELCPLVQKRLNAVYLKATINATDQIIGQIAGLSRQWCDR
jgi:hypothetical protein